MLAGIFAFVLKLFGPAFFDRFFTHLEKRADSDTDRLRIDALHRQHAMNVAAGVVTSGMAYPWFWIPWLIAAVPLSAWLGWGYLDSLFNGALPDVAALPPQLKQYADIILANIFYSGAGMGAASIIGNAIARRK